MITPKTSGSYIFQHSPLTTTCLNLHHFQVLWIKAPPHQQSLYLVQHVTFSSYLDHASPNCQSPYKETTINQNAWVPNRCNCWYSRMSFWHTVHSTSWWNPLNVKFIVSRHLPKSTHRACIRPVTWLTQGVIEFYNRGSALQINRDTQQGVCMPSQVLQQHALYTLHRCMYIHYKLHRWRYWVHNQTFLGPIHHNKHYIIDLLQQCVTHINMGSLVCFI